jgi:hypothetical protein
MSVRASMSSAGRARVIASASAEFNSMLLVAFARRSRGGGGRAEGSEECEGKIKGAARACPECESARGVGAARRPAVPVLRVNTHLPNCRGCGVPSAARSATLSLGPCRGIA